MRAHVKLTSRIVLFDVAVEDGDEVFGGLGFAGIEFGVFAEDVEADFAVDDFNEQAIDGTAAGGDLLEDVGAFALFLDSGANAF